MTAVQTMRDIAFEKVNEDYAWGDYGGFRVLIMLKNGFVNVSKLCTDGNKLLKNWKRLDCADELINEVSSSAHIRADDLLITVTGGQETVIRGTYAHPDLVPHIASWVSPKFAVRVSRIVNEYFAKEARDRLREITRERDGIKSEYEEFRRLAQELHADLKYLKLSNEKLIESNTNLTVKLDETKAELVETTNELVCTTKELLSTAGLLVETKTELVETKTELQEVSVKNEMLNEKINVIAEKLAVGPAVASKEMVFILMGKDIKDKPKTYHIIRGQYKTAIRNRTTLTTDGYKMMMCFLDPNPIDLTDRVRSKLNNKLIIMRYNAFTLKGDVKEDDMVKAIETIRDDKYNEMNNIKPANASKL